MKSTEKTVEKCSTTHAESTVSVSSTTLEKWARLAQNLKSKVDSMNRENEELKERLERQSIEYNDLREENNFQAERLDDLEFQCLEKSAKIANLSDILETRDTSELQEKHLKKSMEHAEMSLSVDRLRLALQKCESANQRLLDEKDTLTEVNEELSTNVKDLTSALQKSKDEQKGNKKLLIEMGDVVRTLNCVTIEFEKESSQQNGVGVSTCSPAENQLDTIKYKIQAMEKDRQRLIQECTSLREENSSNHQRIQVLETHFHSLSTSQTSDSTEAKGAIGPLGSELDTQRSPVSINTSILEQGSHDSESNWSKVSSCSDLAQPPAALLEDHKTLKRYYEEALERMIRMSAELSKSKVSAQELQDKQSHVEELKERLEQMKAERDQAVDDNLRIEKELEEALGLAEITMNDQVTYKTRLEEQVAEYKVLQEKYDSMEQDYSKQLGELERQVHEAEKLFEDKCERLKKKHNIKIKELSKEKESLENEYNDAVKAEKEKNDELNEEFDVFMEIHTQLEDDLSNLQKKYDEALTNIVELEDQVRKVTEMGATEKALLENRIEEQEATVKELKSAVDKSKAAMQEAIVQQQKIRRENETVLAKHGKMVTELAQAQERNKQGDDTIKELRENCCDMENRLQRVVLDASTRFEQLQSSYQKALSRISDLLIQLNSVGLPICEVNEAETTDVSPGAHERIKLLERELMTGGRGFIQSDAGAESEADRFLNDYSKLLEKLIEARRHDESLGGRHTSKPVWYDRLVHHIKLTCIHQHLQRQNEVEFSVLDFIRYQRRLHEVLGSLASRQESVSGVVPEDACTEQSKQELKESSLSSLIHPGFLEHQRRLTVVHYDILACGQDMAPPSEALVQQGPNNIDEAKSALFALKGESQKIKIVANTAKIRYEAREKEHRVVRIQYQKLLEQYNQAVKNQDTKNPSSPDVKLAVEKIQKDQELKRLQEQLRMAELKVDRMTMELRTTKSKADVAQRKHEEGEKNLQDAIGRQEELEAMEPHPLSPVLHEAQQHGSQKSASAIFRTEESRLGPSTPEQRQEEQGRGGTSSGTGDSFSWCKLVKSFDGSHLTSVCGGASISAEGRDERCEDYTKSNAQTEKFLIEGGIGGYLQLQKDHDEALRTIDQLKSELLEAERSVMRARSQLKLREEDLRHVIREYNQIKQESERLFSEIQEKVKVEEEGKAKGVEELDGESGGDNDKIKMALMRERNVALGKISFLETELENAQAAAKAARKKQLLREDHLRQVIGQYKVLGDEHKKTKERVEHLEAAAAAVVLQQQITSRKPGGLLANQRNQGSDERRETPLSPLRRQAPRYSTVRSSGETDPSSDDSTQTAQNKGKAKRKPWFRDLGYTKASAQQSSSSSRSELDDKKVVRV